jgi:site-specific DNA-methyltransferase (adenine-specific)
MHNIDCVKFMSDKPDMHYELAIVDPPYGNPSGRPVKIVHGRKHDTDKYGGKRIHEWNVTPDEIYFRQLFRVSQNQIIWGGNYFRLPPTRGIVVWDKKNISEDFGFAMGEIAWTSYDRPLQIVGIIPQLKERFHPTQKPVALYHWLMGQYSSENMRILDTHAGSGSLEVAAKEWSVDVDACEINEFYYTKAVERIKNTNDTLWDCV